MKKVSKNPKVTARRRSALERLTSQIASGEKTTKDGVQPLSDHDKNRINREISILQERV